MSISCLNNKKLESIMWLKIHILMFWKELSFHHLCQMVLEIAIKSAISTGGTLFLSFRVNCSHAWLYLCFLFCFCFVLFFVCFYCFFFLGGGAVFSVCLFVYLFFLLTRSSKNVKTSLKTQSLILNYNLLSEKLCQSEYCNMAKTL